MCPLLLISPHIANLGNEVASEGSTLTTHAAIPHLVNKVNRHICRSMALHFLEEAFIHLVPPSVPEAIQEENGINILAECPHLEHAAREHSEPYQHHAERTLL